MLDVRSYLNPGRRIFCCFLGSFFIPDYFYNTQTIRLGKKISVFSLCSLFRILTEEIIWQESFSDFEPSLRRGGESTIWELWGTQSFQKLGLFQGAWVLIPKLLPCLCPWQALTLTFSTPALEALEFSEDSQKTISLIQLL